MTTVFINFNMQSIKKFVLVVGSVPATTDFFNLTFYKIELVFVFDVCCMWDQSIVVELNTQDI